MKKNTKKSLGFLALLLMVGLVASFTPGLVSAQEGAAQATQEVTAAEEPAAVEEVFICPVTGEPCNEDCATPVGLGEGNMYGAVNAPVVGNEDSAPNGPAAGTEDGLRIRQNLQDGTAAGGQQRARAQDGIHCLTETVPEG